MSHFKLPGLPFSATRTYSYYALFPSNLSSGINLFTKDLQSSGKYGNKSVIAFMLFSIILTCILPFLFLSPSLICLLYPHASDWQNFSGLPSHSVHYLKAFHSCRGLFSPSDFALTVCLCSLSLSLSSLLQSLRVIVYLLHSSFSTPFRR